MLRLKLLLILLSGVLIIAACGDVGTDPDGPDDPNGEDPVEPTASVNNPEGDATLEGEITFSIDGEAENGFSEARIFVGEEEVEVVDNPNIPYEQTITTFNYDNGDYDLRAELDVAEEDTSIETSVSATFENYLVEIETGGKINQIQDYDSDELLFVAAPDGQIIRKINLKEQQDGTLKILPPEELPEGGAPDHFSLTTVTNTVDDMGNSNMFIITDGAFNPWSNISSREVTTSGGEDGTPDTVQTQVTLSNYPDSHPSVRINSSSLGHVGNFRGEDPWIRTYDFLAGTENMIITTLPRVGTFSDDNIPLYHWKDDLQDGEDVEYNIGKSFSEMEVHSVEWPSGLVNSHYNYSVSIAEDSFDEGEIGRFLFSNEPESGSYDMYVPNTSHQYSTYFRAKDANEDNTFYAQILSGELPDSFKKLDYSVSLENESMDNTGLSISGNDEPDVLFHWRSGNDGAHTWIAILPDTTEQFVYPNIADSLSQDIKSNYDRSSFEESYVEFEILDVVDLENYQEYQENWFELSTGWYPSNRIYKRQVKTFQQSKMAPMTNEYFEKLEKSNFGNIPFKKEDEYGNMIILNNQE